MPRTIAFYLPQFHAIPENDEWWGEGFTEWVNVKRAQPQFESHAHPRTAGELGEYDLSDSEVYRRQTDLAHDAGVDGFCMYFYWFGGKRLLEAPVEAWREDPTLLPYCLSWANESWTRRWDGKSKSVLMAQDYEEGFESRLFADLLPHFKAPHYIRTDGKPVLLVHRTQTIPSSKRFAHLMNKLARDAGLPGLHLVASETTPGLVPSSVGFDAITEFPPVGANTLGSAQLRPVRGVSRGFRGRLMSYPRMASRFENRAPVSFVRYPGVAPAWDNTARRQESATIYVGSSPVRYAGWLTAARRQEDLVRGQDGFVFINAWNEWAEGAYLEPDADTGNEYIVATADPQRYVGDSSRFAVPTARIWSFAQLRSIAIITAGTLLAFGRRLINGVRQKAKP